MSLDNLGNKQTIIVHNCEINNNKKLDLVITPHTKSIRYIRTKRQTITRKVLSKKDRLHEEVFQNEETQSPNQTQVIWKNLTD